jgi:hypothetical protein
MASKPTMAKKRRDVKSKAPKIINLATELRSGRHYGVFIDDTGSPGLDTPGLHSKVVGRCYCAATSDC